MSIDSSQLSNDKPHHILAAEKFISLIKTAVGDKNPTWDKLDCPAFYPYNMITGSRYTGTNLLSVLDKYSDPRWITAKQAKDYGWTVRDGEKGQKIQLISITPQSPALDKTIAISAKTISDSKLEQNGIELTEIIIYNFNQIDFFHSSKVEKKKEWSDHPFARAENLVKVCGARIEHSAWDMAYYYPHEDSITMPFPDQFNSLRRYYATLFHELYHWASVPHRLQLLEREQGDPTSYARDEMRAELTALFMCRNLGMAHYWNAHAEYINRFAKYLDYDPFEIHLAAADAERASKYLMGFLRSWERLQEQEEEYYRTAWVPTEAERIDLPPENPSSSQSRGRR